MGSILESVLMWTSVSVSLGLLYVIFSLGLTLIFGFHEIVNFAHGAFYMVGAFIGLFFYGLTGNFIIAVLAAVVGVMFLSALIERGLISRLYGTEPSNNFLLTFALSLVLAGVVKLIAGSSVRYFPLPEILSGSIFIGNLTIPVFRFFFIGASILLIYLVHLLLSRTKIGIIIRAGTANSSAVQVLGINVKNYFTLLFAIGSGLAAIAAVLAGPIMSVSPRMGDDIILWAFVIVIIGGLGSFKGAVVAGMVVGLIHGLGGVFLGQGSVLLTFAILIVILIVRPEGLFGVRRI